MGRPPLLPHGGDHVRYPVHNAVHVGGALPHQGTGEYILLFLLLPMLLSMMLMLFFLLFGIVVIVGGGGSEGAIVVGGGCFADIQLSSFMWFL